MVPLKYYIKGVKMMSYKTFLSGFFTILFLLGVIVPIKIKAETNLRSMTAEDIINMEKPHSLRISPDNSKVLWVQKAVHDDTYISNIWMASLRGTGEPVKMTNDGSCYSPQWSPDGKSIAFLSDRNDGKSQIFIISPSGGEGERLFSWENSVESFEWKDNDTIIFLSREDKFYYEKQLENAKDDAEIVEDIEAFIPHRLFSYSLEDEKIKRLTLNSDQIYNFAMSPDGKYAVTVHIDSPLYGNDTNYFKKYNLLSLKDMTVKEIFTDPYFSPYSFEWSKEGKLYMIEQKSNYEAKQGEGLPLLYEYSPENDTIKEIPLNWERGVGLLYGRLLDTGGGKIATSLADGALNHFVLIDGNVNRIESPLASNFETFDLSSDGKVIVFVASKANEPPQIYYGKIEGNAIKDTVTLTELNSHLDDVFLAEREIIKWPSEGGREIEGILYYPKDYKEGEKYPLITSIHGGPTWYDGDTFRASWAYFPHILAAKNSFVLEVNYSGSANYGLECLESIFGHYYELEIPDILTGVDYLIQKGMVDPEKLGTLGWSNGSILSIGLTVETDRFKVACCGAGDVNWTSDYGNCAFGVSFDNIYFKGPFWEHLDYYISISPLFKMEKVTTPTLIMFGDSDTSVPTEQGFEHYRALQQMGKVPVKFVLFPGEPHSLGRISHQKRKMKEELAWLDKYLFNETSDNENRSFMSGCPLDIALSKKDFMYGRDGLLGNTCEDILIPETTEFEGITVGRFEVTRAQFQEFLNDNDNISTEGLTGWEKGAFKGGTGNYPVSGINLDTALLYCSWLSEKTGQKYSLPPSKDMDKWLELCSAKENTLDYWAGYELTPDEAVEIEDFVKEMEEGKGIILPAGSFSPSSGNIYDLNGNVSELCSDGMVKGLSACHISDKREFYKEPGEGYTGFRVIIKE